MPASGTPLYAATRKAADLVQTQAGADTVRRISEASRAAAYGATDPQTIDAVFTRVLSNF